MSLGLEYRDFIIETFSGIICMMARWHYFEIRVLNLQDPTLIEVQADIERLKRRLTDLFSGLLNLAASISKYTRCNGLERFGTLYL